MKKSQTTYCYVDKVELAGPHEDCSRIYLQKVDSYDRIQIVTKDLAFAQSLERGDRFEVAIKYKPRKSGVTHVQD